MNKGVNVLNWFRGRKKDESYILACRYINYSFSIGDTLSLNGVSILRILEVVRVNKAPEFNSILFEVEKTSECELKMFELIGCYLKIEKGNVVN